MAIADNIVGCVAQELTRHVLDIVTDRFHSLHLSINHEKCQVLADSQDLLDRFVQSGDPALSTVKVTWEGFKLLGAAISKSLEFHASHIQKMIDEAAPALRAITVFGKDHLQQA